MIKRLTAREAAELAGIEPSTFRAYVARGQAPDPDEVIGSSKIWHESTIRRWRRLPDRGTGHLEADARSSRMWSRSRRWSDSTHADLAQLGLRWEDAEEIINDRSVAGIDLETYLNARHIVHIHEEAKTKMSTGLPPANDGQGEPELISQAAARIASGEDFFAVRADLAVDLTSRGLDEIILPQHFDPTLWDALESKDANTIGNYLHAAERSGFPRIEKAS